MSDPQRKIGRWIVEYEHQDHDAVTRKPATGYVVRGEDGKRGYLKPHDGRLLFQEQLDLFAEVQPDRLFVDAQKPQTDEQLQREFRRSAQGQLF